VGGTVSVISKIGSKKTFCREHCNKVILMQVWRRTFEKTKDRSSPFSAARSSHLFQMIACQVASRIEVSSRIEKMTLLKHLKCC